MYDEFNSMNTGSFAEASFSAAQIKQKKNRTRNKITAIALACTILGGIGGAGLASAIGQTSASADGLPPTVIHLASPEHNAVLLETVSTSQLTDADIYAQNVNSTVGVTTSITTNYWGYTTEAAASGSGFIVSSDGYILTNYHVVEDSNSIKISLYDNRSFPAELIGYDESNDIAVLKIDATDLTPVVLGDSSALRVGDHVVAIGNPLGELTFSLTQGAVSALGREVTFSNGTRMALIQTDAAINSGNSGGALFNSYGEVIGITNAKYGGSSSSASVDNLGFAIPINSVKNIVTSIIEKGMIEKPYIGVSILTVSENVQAYGLPAGVSIQEIVDDSPAAEAGLHLNDIITEADGNTIITASDLTTYVSSLAPGAEMTLKVYREGSYTEITVKVGVKQSTALPEKPEKEESTQQSNQNWSNDFPSNFGSIFPGFGSGFGSGFGY